MKQTLHPKPTGLLSYRFVLDSHKLILQGLRRCWFSDLWVSFLGELLGSFLLVFVGVGTVFVTGGTLSKHYCCSPS